MLWRVMIAERYYSAVYYFTKVMHRSRLMNKPSSY